MNLAPAADEAPDGDVLADSDALADGEPVIETPTADVVVPAELTESMEPVEPVEPVDVVEPQAAPVAVSVGRMFADAIRRAGVRWAFTVPGESFLGLLEGLEAVGINVVATRHEGAAAFMAEAHAQLTGRPAA